ncbi:MAG: nucleotidyl transferase AbiEii/AbiGii toxin family protein [Nitrosotalea sp.]
MGIFFYIDDKLIDFQNPTSLVKDDYRKYFGRRELEPFLLSEICALDMLYAVTEMNNGYYKDRLVLKGGHSVRNHVPLVDHRFSFDADFNPNSPGGFTFGDVSDIRKDLNKYGSLRGCETKTRITEDSAMLHFIEVGYRSVLSKLGYTIIEPPKIEICKTCRTHERPIMSEMKTMIDLNLLGLKPLVLAHLSLEEQLANKLHVIGARGRQRNNFDAYDVYRICKNNKVDWKKTKGIFDAIVTKSGKKPSDYIAECRRQLDTMLSNERKQINLTNVIFDSGSFDFKSMISDVKSRYDFH